MARIVALCPALVPSFSGGGLMPVGGLFPPEPRNVDDGSGVLGTTPMHRPEERGSGRPPAWLGVACAMLASGWAVMVGVAQEPAAGAPPPAPAGQQMVLASGPGADVFQRVCVLCHTPDRIVSVRKSKVEWEEIIDKMITRGAQVTDDNYGPIEDYLLRNYGKVNVNKAVKDDLVVIGGLTAAEADAVVAFRTASGPIADFAALGKVPGLDAKKLDERRDAFTF